MTDWEPFFLPGSPVTALPHWRRPRLYLLRQNVRQSWQASGFYPAYRWQTQLLRSLLRLRATCLPSTATSRQAWLLAEWPPHILADLRPAALLVGTPGPAQKLTLRLVDASGRVAAFLKWSDKPAGIARLQCERRVLEALPRGLGPAVLHFGEAGGGVGLLVEALSGRPGVPRPQVPPDALAFLEVLQQSATVSTTTTVHPWLARWLEQPAVASWAAKLTRRAWPVVPQHGDFTPWNLVGAGRDLRAIDWEYGQLDGFPGVDLAYFVLQVGALIYRWEPEYARQQAAAQLRRVKWLTLDNREADALVRLTAYAAFEAFQRDGHRDDRPQQRWRRAVWQTTE